ncbi:TAXI family TRAP transporter solute-binding subunit [Collimonas sp. NPDC087041]|uniref:TAXI family TRAP transporter solute-binding subunit n=1 Tax=Collimonas sp. NPDC087041 TaxID=3363960 RepID=UPI003800F4D9
MSTIIRRIGQVRLLAYGLVLILVIHLALVAMPSKTITIAAGPESGTYYQNAVAYRKVLEQRGYRVQVVPEKYTETIAGMVNDPKSGIDVGFVAQELRIDRLRNIVSLGDIELEPVFLFARRSLSAQKKIGSFSDLKGLRVVLPPERSVTSQAVSQIFKLCNVSRDNTVIEYRELDDAIRQLEAGKADAGIFMLGADNKLVAGLAKNPELKLIEVGQIDALVKNIPFLQHAVLPAGIYDRERNIPPADVQLLAARVSIIVKKSLPPATVYAVMEAMSEVHRAGNYVSQPREFPSYLGTELPLHPLAPEFYRVGTPWIFNNLPPALANIVDSYLMPMLALWLLVGLRRSVSDVDGFRHFLQMALSLLMLKWLQRRARLGQPFAARETWMLARIERWIARHDKSEAVRQALAELQAGIRRQPG